MISAKKVTSPKYGSPESDRAFGLHSNIPECCVDFYINKWLEIGIDNMIDTDLTTLLAYRGWEYIPCGECIQSGRRNKIHLCDENCIEFLIEKVGMSRERAEAKNEDSFC